MRDENHKMRRMGMMRRMRMRRRRRRRRRKRRMMRRRRRMMRRRRRRRRRMTWKDVEGRGRRNARTTTTRGERNRSTCY